jgi:cellobiose transport system substrate-binding protein
MRTRTPGVGSRHVALAAVTVGLLALSACSSSSGGDGTATQAGAATSAGGGKVTLTLATFNQFGYEELLPEFEKTHPNIKVTHKKAATSNEARDNFFTRLSAGSGMADVEAVEVDWLPEMLQFSDKFTDLKSSATDGRWLDWKAKAATDADGHLIGYGTDSGPEAICYRSDLFKKAGLPTDRDEVAALMGTWDDYFATGEEFVSKVPGTAWYDSTGGTAQAMLNQVENPFETSNNTIDVENADLQAVYEKRYRGEPFIDVMPPGSLPDTRSVRASNVLRIAVHRPPDSDLALVIAVEDNLVKGAAGQAIQNMNLMFGLPETAGLMAPPVLP